jgi:hypothetical protein
MLSYHLAYLYSSLGVYMRSLSNKELKFVSGGNEEDNSYVETAQYIYNKSFMLGATTLVAAGIIGAPVAISVLPFAYCAGATQVAIGAGSAATMAGTGVMMYNNTVEKYIASKITNY